MHFLPVAFCSVNSFDNFVCCSYRFYLNYHLFLILYLMGYRFDSSLRPTAFQCSRCHLFADSFLLLQCTHTPTAFHVYIPQLIFVYHLPLRTSVRSTTFALPYCYRAIRFFVPFHLDSALPKFYAFGTLCPCCVCSHTFYISDPFLPTILLRHLFHSHCLHYIPFRY